MRVNINRIAAAGDLDQERVVLKVSSKDDIGNYALLRSAYEDGSVTTDISHAFWFPDESVASGDLVILYSRVGIDKTKKNSDGTKSHFFYWDSPKPLWKDDSHAPVLLHVYGWTSLKPPFAYVSLP